MNYHDQWNALSNRIRGLMQAAQLHARFLQVRSSDTYRTGTHLLRHVNDVISSLQLYEDNFRHMLPPPALDAIGSFLDQARRLANDSSGGSAAKQERVWAALILLGAFETEVSFIFSDSQQFIRARSERAFSHLQRIIVADGQFREKWKAAFDDGEIACEKLGAIHLLLHGIFAFKVDAAGARTDLVFQEQAGLLIDEQRYVDGFVLTEWKKVTSKKNAEQQFEQARFQAARYAQGALAGSELAGYRYAVVVSRQQVPLPDDLTKGGVVYRHINVAVEPRIPSRGQ